MTCADLRAQVIALQAQADTLVVNAEVKHFPPVLVAELVAVVGQLAAAKQALDTCLLAPRPDRPPGRHPQTSCRSTSTTPHRASRSARTGPPRSSARLRRFPMVRRRSGCRLLIRARTGTSTPSERLVGSSPQISLAPTCRSRIRSAVTGVRFRGRRPRAGGVDWPARGNHLGVGPGATDRFVADSGFRTAPGRRRSPVWRSR